MMRYMLDEVETELDYAERYKKAETNAEIKAKETKQYYWYHMPDNLKRTPSKSLVKSRMKLIRELALKFYET